MRKLLKIVSAIMCIAIMLSLSACGKSEEVVAVEKLISEIGSVSLGSESAIKEAEKAYNTLPTEDQEKVSNYDDLIKAKETYASLVTSVEGALCSYIVNQPERNGCIFDTLSVDTITVNDETVTVTGVATFSSDKSYTCKFTSVVSETTDSSSIVIVESWEDNFDEVYKSAQPVHWEVAYYVDEFGDYTDESYIRGVFEGSFDNSAGYGMTLTTVLFFDQNLNSASYDCFSIRLLEYGDNPAHLSTDTDYIDIKIKVDGKVYSDEPWLVDGADIYITRGSDVFRGVIDGLNAGKEVSFVITDSRYGVTTYQFKIDAFGLDDITHSWKSII